MTRRDGPDGQALVLDVAHLVALLEKTFNIGLDVGRGREKVDLVRLRLSKALVGAAEAQALVAESMAIEGGVPSGSIAEAEGLALHAGAFNGIPDLVFHLTARAVGIVTGLAAVEPDPAAPDQDLVLDIAVDAATALAGLLRFRSACVTATTGVEQAHATATLVESGALLTRAVEAVTNLLELAELTAASGRVGGPDLN